MSREIDYDNLSPEDIAYLRDRPFMDQPTDAQINAMLDRMNGPSKTEKKAEPVKTESEPEKTEPTTEEPNDNDSGDSGDENGSGDDDDEIIIEDDGYEDQTVAWLKDECERRGLKKSGNHGELVDRLREADQEG